MQGREEQSGEKKPTFNYIAKETCVHGNRALTRHEAARVGVRDRERQQGAEGRCTAPVSKEAYVYGKRDLRIWQKRPAYMAKEPYEHWERKQASWRMSARPSSMRVRPQSKRDLRVWQKKPACIPKETCVYGNKRLTCILTLQKRPAYIAKETCLYCKRDLLTLAAGVGGRPRVSRSFEWGKEALLQSKRLTNTIVIGRCNNL